MTLEIKEDKLKELYNILSKYNDYIPLKILPLGGNDYFDRVSDETRKRIFMVRNGQPSGGKEHTEYFENDLKNWLKEHPEYEEYFEENG